MQPDESAVDFANRIKSEIARKGGLVDLEWDGGLKRDHPKPKLKEDQQEGYSSQLKLRLEHSTDNFDLDISPDTNQSNTNHSNTNQSNTTFY